MIGAGESLALRAWLGVSGIELLLYGTAKHASHVTERLFEEGLGAAYRSTI